MSTATVSQISHKHKKEKDKERTNSLPQPNERLKTVVRRLPPNLPEEVFWQSVQPWVTEETAVWKVYYPGKLRKKCAHSTVNGIPQA
jgi:regulator of nonsense transcripts 3